jgi:phosphoribosylformylglycinamidine synthase
MTDIDKNKLQDILSEKGKYTLYENSKFLGGKEIGPLTNFKTTWCQNMLDILEKCGVKSVDRIEFSIKYKNHTLVPNYDKMIYKNYYEGYFSENIQKNSRIINSNKAIEYVNISKYNNQMELNLSVEDVARYTDIFNKLGRQATNVEIYDIAQSQSEHARHWFFKGKINGTNVSLFDKISSCYNPEIHSNSLISFYDNASVIEGGLANHLSISESNIYTDKMKKINYSYKAETHNFPTGISPFPGAATGVGGRIRDVLCVGKGGQIIAGTAGYCVGDISLNSSNYSSYRQEYGWLPQTPRKILIEASNGASDYGNKIGEPLIQGFTRSYRQDFTKCKENNCGFGTQNKNVRIEWLKPIMFSGGIGYIFDRDIKKNKPEVKNLIVRVGGPAYRIGMGGGSSSSRTQSNDHRHSDFQAVQRGDPLMANKMLKFLRTLLVANINPIVSIHDQGSGGMANVTREICEEKGAIVYLDEVLKGDTTLTSLEVWVAEYQEQITLLIAPKDLTILKKIGKRENISVIAVGTINNSGHLKVLDKLDGNKVVDLPVNLPSYRKKYTVKKREVNYDILNYRLRDSYISGKKGNNFIDMIEKVFSLVDVGSKQFLTNKVDRSVGGLVVQQQCIGPHHLPLSNYAAVKNSFESSSTLVSAIGEKPIIGVSNKIEDMVNMTVGEMLTNIIWCNIGNLQNINSVANWMWSSIDSEDGFYLQEAVNKLVTLSHTLGFSINGGKDSLSMKVKNNMEDIKAPKTLTLSGYATIKESFRKVTPNLKSTDSMIILIRLDNFRGGMLGSAYSRFYQVKPIPTKWIQIYKFPKIWIMIQRLIRDNKIISGHDISDGGLITTLIEMAISSNIGLDLKIKSEAEIESYFFSEELGLVLEVSRNNYSDIINEMKREKINVELLGITKTEREVYINYNGSVVLDEKNDDLRFLWQKTSYQLEKEQANPKCIDCEIENCYHLPPISYQIDKTLADKLHYNNILHYKFSNQKPKVAIMRGEGSNGEMEMAYALIQVGFECYDINIADILETTFELGKFRGIIWVGGFTFSDVLGAAQGWYHILQNNKNVREELDMFYQRDDTFSLGVCNGCQLMAKLGWVGEVSLVKNVSERFESRWSRVKILDGNNIFFTGMENTVIGIYTAHGEGRMVVKDENDDLYPVRYVDREDKITEKYPFNPNGSLGGRAAVVSPNGRHLAIMPHPERTIMGWQVPHQYGYNLTPWFIMFKNMFLWCVKDEDEIEENGTDSNSDSSNYYDV